MRENVEFAGSICKNPLTEKLTNPTETVSACLKEYSREEAAFNVINSKCKSQENRKTPPPMNMQFLPSESVKELLSPELSKSRFISFKEKFLENMYFKKPELGQVLTLRSKPQEFTNENFTYGLKNTASENIYDLIFSNKSANDVKVEFLKCTDKYLRLHKDYLPSERIRRSYNSHFDPQATYGIFNNIDRTGLNVRKCLQHCNRMVAIHKSQKEFINRTRGQLGSRVDRFNLNLDPNQAHGIVTKNESNIRELIEYFKPCEKKVQIMEAISHINNLRRILFKRSKFHMNELKLLLNKYQENGTVGFITIKSIMEVLRLKQIPGNEGKIRVAVSHLEMLQNKTENNELVNIEEFWKALHLQYPLPRKIIGSDENNCNENKQTTYRLLCSDLEKTPAERRQQKLKGDRITSGDLIAPGIPLQYGLNPKDFRVLRSKEDLKSIFKCVLPQNFETIWQFACPPTFDISSFKFSIAEFRNKIDKYNQNVTINN